MSIWARLGGTIGSGLGQGISSGLEQVAQRRTQELARKQFIKDFTSEGMFTPQEAGLLFSLPEKDRFEAAQLLAARNNQYEQSSQQPAFQDLVDEERGIAPQQQQQAPSLAGLFAPQMTQRLLQQPPAQAMQSPSVQNMQQPRAPEQFNAVTQQLEQAAGERQQGKGQSIRSALSRNSTGSKSTKEDALTKKKIETAQALIKIADEMEKLHSTGKVLNGRWGTWQRKLGPLGVWEPNDETNTFDSLASESAVLAASLIPGQTTDAKLTAAERIKPNITQTKKTQLARINAMRNTAKDILSRYGYDQNKNNKQIEQQKSPGKLPSAESAQGKTYKNKRGNQRVKSVQVDGQWVWKAQ